MRDEADGGFSALLAAARRGEDPAWRELHRALAAPLRGYLRARGVPDPDDLIGEVFLSVVRGLSKFSGGEREFRAWVFTIAHRRMVDATRAHARRLEEIADDTIVLAAGGVGDAEEDAVRAVSEAEIRRALDRLTPEQRTVLLLRLFADMTIEDIARAVGKRSGAVKQLQRRGLEALRRSWQPHGVPMGLPVSD